MSETLQPFKLKVTSYTVNERYDRVVVLNNGAVYISKSRGVSGQTYHPWTKWDIMAEIERDNPKK